MKFMVESDVFAQLPDVCFGVVIGRGIDNMKDCPDIDQLLDLEIDRLPERIGDVKVKEHPAMVPYRNAFSALGFNPNKYMSSIEALVSRVAKGAGFPKINPVVNLCNAVSLRYLVPMGAHDMDCFTDDIMVRFAGPSDQFIPFGQTEPDNPPPGELVYASGSEIKTRRWIWRQSEMGKITGVSRNIFFPIDGFSSSNRDMVEAALQDLASYLRTFFACDVQTALVDSSQPFIQL